MVSYIAPKRMLMTAAITSPPSALPAVTTTAPTHTIRAQEQNVTTWNIPVPKPFTNASVLLILSCFCKLSEKDLIAEFSPTNANTVLMWEIVCQIASKDECKIMLVELGETSNMFILTCS